MSGRPPGRTLPEYGVQDDGTFKRKEIDVIQDDIEEDFINILGEDIELRPNSPIQQLINASAIEFAKQWACIESVYYTGFFEDSFGVQLDKKLALAGFQRRTLRGATGEIRFEVTEPAQSTITISEGTKVQAPQTDTRPRIPFETTETTEINEGETSAIADIKGLEPWDTDIDPKWLGEETNLPANTITEFTNPQSQVDSLTNPFAMGDGKNRYTEGRDRETDPEFKNRYIASFAQPGDATVDAIEPTVFNADPGIVSVDVQEIHDVSEDDYGVLVTVLAPNVPNNVIAQAIFNARAAGLESFGSNTGTAIDDDNEEHQEQFNRAEAVFIEATIEVFVDNNFDTDGTQRISDKLTRYIGGTNSDGTTFPGLEIGEDMLYDQFLRRVLNQEGVREAEIDLGVRGGTLNRDNVTINDLESARVEPDDLTYTVTSYEP